MLDQSEVFLRLVDVVLRDMVLGWITLQIFSKLGWFSLQNRQFQRDQRNKARALN